LRLSIQKAPDWVRYSFSHLRRGVGKGGKESFLFVIAAPMLAGAVFGEEVGPKCGRHALRFGGRPQRLKKYLGGSLMRSRRPLHGPIPAFDKRSS
jgi:hypothetical protein